MQCNIDIFKFSSSLYSNVGDDTFECDHCQALGFKDENRATGCHDDGNPKCHYGIICCNQSKVMLDELPQVPPVLQNLYIGDTCETQFFQDNMHGMNTPNGFRATKVNYQTIRKFGPESAFKIVGQVQRTAGSLLAGVK